MGHLGDAHRARHLRISGHGRPSQETCDEARQSVAKHRAMQPRLLHEVLVCHGPHHVYIANVLDYRSNGHRNHVEERFPREGRPMEMYYRLWQGKPRCGLDGCEVYQSHAQRDDISHDDSADHRHQPEQSASERQHKDGRDQRDECQRPVGLRHIHGSRRERQSDENNHRTDDHRREKPVEKFLALPLDQCRHEKIDHRHANDTGQRSGHAPLLGSSDDGCDERKTAAQENGHATLGDKMKRQGADAGSHQ